MHVVLGGSAVKNLPANADDTGLIPGSGRSPGEGKGNLPSILAWEIPLVGCSPWGAQKTPIGLND